MRVCAHKRRCGSCGSLRGCATMQVHVLIHRHIADRVSQPLSTMGSSETVNKPPLPLKTSQKLQRAQRGMPTPDPDLLLPLACLADHNSKFSAFRHYSGHVTPCMSPLSTMLVSARTSLTSSPPRPFLPRIMCIDRSTLKCFLQEALLTAAGSSYSHHPALSKTTLLR